MDANPLRCRDGRGGAQVWVEGSPISRHPHYRLMIAILQAPSHAHAHHAIPHHTRYPTPKHATPRHATPHDTTRYHTTIPHHTIPHHVVTAQHGLFRLFNNHATPYRTAQDKTPHATR